MFPRSIPALISRALNTWAGKSGEASGASEIFAKALNCTNLQDGEPCNECANCIAADQGSMPDIMEIDAASNNGVDEIREIRDKVKYAPTEGKYKVYIIDEVHSPVLVDWHSPSSSVCHLIDIFC